MNKPNAFYAMFMPIFWNLYKADKMITVPNFQMHILKKLHMEVARTDIHEFFNEMQNIGYGEFIIYEIPGMERFNSKIKLENRAFKCILKEDIELPRSKK